MAQQTVGDLAKAVESIKATTGKVVRQSQALGLDNKAVNTLLAGGTIAGAPRQTLRELKKLMQAAAIDGKIVTVNTQTGEARYFKPEFYAEMVYQTKLAETTNIATLQRLQSRKIFYTKIIGSNSRNFCTAFVGRVFYTGDGNDPLGQFPHVRELPRGGPPFHPRCTKRYTAFVPKLAAPEQIEAAKLKPGERELLGKSGSAAQREFKKTLAPPAPPSRKTASPRTGRSPAADDDLATMIPAPPAAGGELLPRPPTERVAGAADQATLDRRVARDSVRGVEGWKDYRRIVSDRLSVPRSEVDSLIHSAVPNVDGTLPKAPYVEEGSSDADVKIYATGSGDTELDRRIFRDADGKLVLEANLFRLDDSLRGKGLARKIFTEMAENLAALGFDRIETLAARDDAPDGYVGYIVWPKLGYDRSLETLPKGLLKKLQDSGVPIKGRTLLDLISTKEGLDLWQKKVGDTVNMVFDLKPGSKSWQKLRRGERKQ